MNWRPQAALCLAAIWQLAGCAITGTDGTVLREFRDCADCPLMIELPAGRFMMGSLPAETDGRGWPAKAGGNERPQHEVVISRGFALGKYEVTRAQFSAFVARTGYASTGGCLDFSGGAMGVVMRPENDWRNPGFRQADDEPAVCISWLDAQAYLAWLSQETGQAYRLASEAEWEYAARAGTASAYPWGEEAAAACRFANVRADAAWRPDPSARPGEEGPYPCDDGHRGPAPVGSYTPNGFGLHDMVGNVFEWTQDCNHPDYAGAPADGSAWLDEKPCVFRVMKGGSYSNGPRQTRSAARVGRPVSGRAPMLGFRIARSLDGVGAATGSGTVLRPVAAAGAAPEDSALFKARCADCHVDAQTFRGVYGRDQAAIEQVIREGGANSMSMPPWRGVLTDEEIRRLARYVRQVAGWE